LWSGRDRGHYPPSHPQFTGETVSDAISKANAAIYYIPEGYTVGGPKLMGRHAAGEGFINGFFRHAAVDKLFCYAPQRAHAEDFVKRAKAAGNESPVVWISKSTPQNLAQVGTLYLPDPGVAEAAWRRRAGDQRRYSIVGVTHTTASFAAMDGITNLLAGPVQEWDGLVCTSASVRDTVNVVLEAQAEYLAARLGAVRFPRPQLPVIPLGVDTGAFAPDATRRGEWRRKLEIGDDDIAVLFVGRLSFHGKAHPLPMYVGLEQAARGQKRRVHLIQAGWFANKYIEKAFTEGANAFCPSIRCLFLDAREPDVRWNVWQAADIFTSLSDNIQETFGLTPVEAMAAGVPSVVTDWNGYRDTVRHGVDGLRVPTLAPPPGWGEDLADGHAAETITYDVYCGLASQLVVVDPAAAAQAYRTLIADAALRKKLGAAARRRAVESYDWRVIVARYQQLWAELGELRRRAGESAERKAGTARPSRADPFLAMRSYPSDALSGRHVAELMPGATAQVFDTLARNPLLSLGRSVAAGADDMHRLIAELQAKGKATVADAVAGFPPERRQRMARSLLWLAKMGMVRLHRPATAKPGNG
jgi:glycosyltransferase involved in cell wall biosynthesis